MLWKIIQRLNALIEAGLVYGKDAFDLERYQEMKQLMNELTRELTEMNIEELKEIFGESKGYPTPKIDVRAFILNQKKQVLLVKEKRNDEWSLPGGYGEIGYSLNDNILKEIFEETGHQARILRLLAVFDTNHWQPQASQYYKFVFYARILDGVFQENIETSEIRYFSVDELPESLSQKRNTKEQIEKLFELVEKQQIYID